MNAEIIKDVTQGKELTMEELAALVNQADPNVVISIALTAEGGEVDAWEKGIGWKEI